MTKEKNHGAKSFSLSHIEAAGRAMSKADFVLNRIYEELTDYSGEDLTPPEVIATLPGIPSKEREGDLEEVKEPVADYGFSFHQEADLNELILQACGNTEHPRDAIHYNKESDSFYRLLSPATEVGVSPKEAVDVIANYILEFPATKVGVSPEEVVSVIVDYILEFSDENDDWRITGEEREGGVIYQERNPEDLLKGADYSDLEVKLNELKIASDEATVRKALAEALSTMEKTYEGLTFPGKAQGTKKEKQERELFLDQWVTKSKSSRDDKENAAYFLEQIGTIADEAGADVATAYYVGGMKLPPLTRNGQEMFYHEAYGLLDAYQSLSDKPQIKAQAEKKEAARQRALDFYALRSREAQEFLTVVELRDTNQRLREERNNSLRRVGGLEAENAGLKARLHAEKNAVDNLEKGLNEANTEKARYRGRSRWLIAAAAAGTLAGFAGGLALGTYYLGPSQAGRTIKQLKQDNAALINECDNYEAYKDAYLNLLHSLPARRVEQVLVAKDPNALVATIDSYLEQTGPMALPGENCFQASKNLARQMGLREKYWTTFAQTLAQTDYCQKPAKTTQRSTRTPVVWFRK